MKPHIIKETNLLRFESKIIPRVLGTDEGNMVRSKYFGFEITVDLIPIVSVVIDAFFLSFHKRPNWLFLFY